MYHLVTFDGEWRNLTVDRKILCLINIMVFFMVANLKKKFNKLKISRGS